MYHPAEHQFLRASNAMNLIHKLRSLLGIRTERQIPPLGHKPQVGSILVRNRLKVRLRSPLQDEQWEWLGQMGWRRVDMRANRRHYEALPDQTMRKLLDKNHRMSAHQKILDYEQRLAEKARR